MFACRVHVLCTDAVGRSATFRRVLLLPFCPFPGGPELGFAHPSHHWSGEVLSVVYENETGELHVDLQDWDGPSLDEMAAELGPEWTRLPRAA